jgi:hypothetical protein
VLLLQSRRTSVPVRHSANNLGGGSVIIAIIAAAAVIAGIVVAADGSNAPTSP